MTNFAREFCERPSEVERLGRDFVLSSKVLADVQEVFEATATAMRRELKRVCEERVTCSVMTPANVERLVEEVNEDGEGTGSFVWKIVEENVTREASGIWNDTDGVDTCDMFRTNTSAHPSWGYCTAN